MIETGRRPVDLLTSSRLDILGKLPFARAYLEGRQDEWATKLFRDCLMALHPTGRFGEDDRKHSLGDYEREFVNLLESLRSKGFIPQVSKIPLASDGSVWNGAHRMAAALALDIGVDTQQTCELPQIYDFKFFERAAIPSDSLSELSWGFAQAVQESRAFVFNNLESQIEQSLLKKLRGAGKIFFQRTVDLSQIGVRRHLELMYGHLDWFSESLLEKLVLERFQPGKSMRSTVVGFHPDEAKREREIKESLRANLPESSFERSVHGSDDWSETIRLLEVWTSQNSLNFMNSAPLGSEDRVINELHKIAQESKFQIHRDLVIDAGASLEVQGIRQASDLDHVCRDNHPAHLAKIGDCHNSLLLELGLNPSNLLDDPRMHIRWRGYKFSSIQWELIRASVIRDRKSTNDLRSIADFFERADIVMYSDKGRDKALKAWQRSSRLQLLVDRILAIAPRPVRRSLAMLGQAYRSKIRRS
jgi:hypothetical protein